MVVQVTRMVPADRAVPPAPGRAAAPDGRRGIPLSEPTIRVGTSARRSTTPGLLPKLDGFAAAPVVDHPAAE
jgi:hypothetical protein